jgi:hypothetical protein
MIKLTLDTTYVLIIFWAVGDRRLTYDRKTLPSRVLRRMNRALRRGTFWHSLALFERPCRRAGHGYAFELDAVGCDFHAPPHVAPRNPAETPLDTMAPVANSSGEPSRCM